MNKARLVVAPASTAYKHSLKEVFSAPGIVGQIKVRVASALAHTRYRKAFVRSGPASEALVCLLAPCLQY